jgi:hypothetical protein
LAISMPSRYLKSATMGIEPPQPISTASLPHSWLSASCALASWGSFQSSEIAAAPVWSMNSALQSADPLFSLPQPAPRELPAKPFRHLQSYGEEYAELFSGRADEIHSLWRCSSRLCLYTQYPHAHARPDHTSGLKSRTRPHRLMTAVPSTAEDPTRPGRGSEAAPQCRSLQGWAQSNTCLRRP